MDSNRTRYHHVVTRADWLGTADAPHPGGDRLTVVEDRVQLRPLLRLHVPSARDRALTLAQRRGGFADASGAWVRIDEDETALVLTRPGEAPRRYWPPEADPPQTFSPVDTAPRPRRLRGLCVTTTGLLVVGVPDEQALLVFDLRGTVNAELVPVGAGVRPFDLAALPGGGLLVLDRGDAPHTPQRMVRLCRLDQNLELQVQAASPLDAVAIDAFLDGELVVLAREADGGAALHRLPTASLAGAATAPLSIEEAITRASLGASREGRGDRGPHDVLWAPDPADPESHGSVLVALADGNQVLRLDIPRAAAPAAWATLQPDLLQTPRAGGRGLLLAGGRGWFDTELGARCGIAPLVASRRKRYQPRAQGALATLELAVMDSGLVDCAWHRVIVEGSVPAGCAVRVHSRAADELATLRDADWWPQPALVQRARSDLPFHLSGPEERTWELLLQDAPATTPGQPGPHRGRYLQLRLTWEATSAATPALRALRAYFPRFSYLERYLPAAWRLEDEPGSVELPNARAASFAERYLANVEGMFTDIEDWIAAAHLLLDPGTAPADALPWLASWFQISLDPGWDEQKSRFFLQHLGYYLRWRGTARGVRAALRLALAERVHQGLLDDSEDEVRLVELFTLRRTPVDGELDDARWRPAEGRGALLARWRAAGGEGDLPVAAPADEPARWRSFCAATLGVVPDAAAGDVGAWRCFLRRRYRRASALSAAWGRPIVGFDTLILPDRLPADGAPLRDWFDFVTQVLPRRRLAHRFVVLVPDPGPRPGARAQLRALARRVVEASRPAHTTFVIRLGQADFVVGRDGPGMGALGAEAGAARRTGGLVLGEDAIGQASLGLTPSWDVPDRLVLDRDALPAAPAGDPEER